MISEFEKLPLLKLDEINLLYQLENTHNVDLDKCIILKDMIK